MHYMMHIYIYRYICTYIYIFIHADTSQYCADTLLCVFVQTHKNIWWILLLCITLYTYIYICTHMYTCKYFPVLCRYFNVEIICVCIQTQIHKLLVDTHMINCIYIIYIIPYIHISYTMRMYVYVYVKYTYLYIYVYT